MGINTSLSEIEYGNIHINHNSTSSTFTITVKDDYEDHGTSIITLDYYQMDDLIESLKKITE